MTDTADSVSRSRLVKGGRGSVVPAAELRTYYDKPEMLAEISTGLGEPMLSLDIRALTDTQLMAARGW